MPQLFLKYRGAFAFSGLESYFLSKLRFETYKSPSNFEILTEDMMHSDISNHFGYALQQYWKYNSVYHKAPPSFENPQMIKT